MPVYYCPLCHAPLKRRCRKDNAQIFFWSCTGYRQGCTFCCDDFHNAPYLKNCPQCGKTLRYKISQKTGKPYVACFNQKEHASKTVLFFNEDGTPAHTMDHPVAKAIFTCPECHGELLYRHVRNGRYAGQKNIFLCPNTAQHKDGKVHFFEDQEGEPLL